MKVCILSASPNKVGLTNSCVEICINTLIEDNVKTEWKILNKYNLKRCEACGKRGWGICYDKGNCRMDDDFNSLQKELEEYDAYIIISPVYFHEMSEVAKTFFDRLKRCQAFNKESKITEKTVLFIACAGGSGSGTENTLNSMNILAKFMKWNIADAIGVNLKNFDEKRTVIKESCKNIFA